MTRWYAEYLESPWWLAVRRAALELAGYTCRGCGYRRFPYKLGGGKRLEVNHLNYTRLGAERPEDVEVLCEDCHHSYHGLPSHLPVYVAGCWHAGAIAARMVAR